MSHRKLAMLQPAPPVEPSVPPIQPPEKKKKDSVVETVHQPLRKRAGVNSNGACEPCRKGKRRCDGGKPTCSACLKRDIERSRCVYDQMEGLSRAGTLKHNAQILEAERDSLRTFVRELMSVAPGTTVEEGIRLTEEQGVVLPRGLRVEIDDILQQRQAGINENVSMNNDSIPTPITTGTDYHTGQSSPDFDVSYPRSVIGRSSSPTMAAISTDNDRSHTSQFRFLKKNLFDREDVGNLNPQVQERGFRGSANTDHFSQQALSALCDKMAEENSQARLSRRYLGDQENTPNLTGHLQVYAHMPLTVPVGRIGWPATVGVQDPQVLDLQIPMYMVQPLLTEDESPLSRTVVGFLELARARVKQGWPLLDILGPIDFDVSRLTSFDIGYDPYFDVFSVPGWATSVVMTFPNASTIVKLSLVLQLARLMRWLIAPTPDNYGLIPESQRPTPLQRMVPHKAEYDFLMLPAVRDALIMRPREYIQVYFDSAKCDWSGERPYVEVDPQTNCLKITPDFEQHISDIGNWYFDDNILQVFPELVGKCDHRGIAQTSAMGWGT